MALIQLGLATCNLAFWMLGFLRRYAAKGTRLRYACASIQWAILIPALVSPVLSALRAEHLHSVIIFALNFLCMLWWWYDLKKDDDDNYWRRKRKQLKRRLAEMRVRSLQPSLGGVR